MAKRDCPITRAQFRTGARNLKCVIDGREYDLDVKEFSTGSLGWSLVGKATVEVGGMRVPVQVGLNITLVGSKELPSDPPAASASTAS